VYTRIRRVSSFFFNFINVSLISLHAMDHDADIIDIESDRSPKEKLSVVKLPFEEIAIKYLLKLTFRVFSLSARYFWKNSYYEQQLQTVKDKVFSGSYRFLSGNEIAVMVLNEIVIARGHGFFLYFKNRDG
jgi:hypothetical protein